MLTLPDGPLVLHLVNGQVLIGRTAPAGDGWIRLATQDGERLVNLAHVVMIELEESADEGPQEDDGALMRPRSKERPIKAGHRTPGRPWQDPDLKALSEGFLDGLPDKVLAERHHRVFSQIRDLRQAFECQRGNIPDDQLSPAASTWVARWRRVLANR